MWRRWLILFLAQLTACTGAYRTPPDTLVVALSAQPATLDPRFATDASGMRISGLIFESLVRAGEGFRPVPEAAERWVSRPGAHTFFLRPGLAFHNGRTVEPEDIEFSFAFFRGDKSPFASNFSALREVRVRKAENGLVVDLRLARDSEKFLLSDLPAVKILPKRELLAAGADFPRRLVGTGPFRYVKEDLNEIRLDGVRAGVAHLKFKIVRDDFTRFQKLLKGEVDLIQAGEIPADKLPEFEKRADEFQVFRYPGLAMTYVLLNLRDPLLRDIRVRRALSQTLRRDEIVRFKLNGLAREATSLLTPENPYHEAGMVNPPHDAEAARAAVRALGLNGRKLILKTSNTPQAIDNGKVLANQLSESGLAVELESYEWGTFYSDIRKGAFQLATMRWVGTVDPDLYRMAFHSRELPPGRNRGGYANAEVDRLLDQAEAAADPERRRALFARVQRLVHDDLAILPLWYDEQVAVARRNVLNFKPSLTSDFLPLARVSKLEMK